MWAIETYTIVDGWTNCWHEDDKLMTFDDPIEAVEELMDFFECLMQASMDFCPEEYRLRQLTDSP
jgi:hypothetical protein